MTASLSDYEKIAVGKEVESFDVSPQFDAYSGVIITDSEGNEELVGTDTGRTITIPGITREQAQAILADLTQSGFQYQPYTAQNAILNPAAELGDGVAINGTYSGIYKMSRNYSPLMTADIEAPQDEEIDHEYPYEPKQDRVFKRELAQAMTRVSQTEDAITLEAQRATDAEGVLRSSINQTASEVSAKVSQTGGNNSSFGWSLTSSSFDLYSGGSRVFRATASGVEISGKITATSGSIGGFDIVKGGSGEWKMQSGKTYLWDERSGVYLGTNGISCGPNFVVDSTGKVWAYNIAINGGSMSVGDRFRVNSSGNLTANNATLTGTLTIGGQTITAAALRSGAQSAYNNSGTWSTGAGYGYNYNAATQNGTSSYPSYFTVTNLTVKNRASIAYLTASSSFGCPSSFQVGGIDATWKQVTISGVTIKYLGRS